MARRSAQQPQDDDGRQYHIGLAPGEVAPHVMLVGDPGRVALAEALLDDVSVRRQSREYVSVTGRRGELDVTVLGTGIGCDNTEIAVLELLACRRDLSFLRVGSCGSLRADVPIGDLVITTGAHRLESTSLGFVDAGFPAVAHHEVVLALVTAARRAEAAHHLGVTATASGFYGWQGRTDAPVPSLHPDLPERLASMGVTNFEMEASTLLTLASRAQCRAGVVCTVFANRPADEFIGTGPEKKAAEARAVEVGLDALTILTRMDARAGGRPFALDEGWL